MLDEVTERIAGERTSCIDDRVRDRLAWNARDDGVFPYDLFRIRQPTAEQRREFAYRLAAHILVQSNKQDNGSTENLWNQLHCLVDTHRKYSSPIETINVDVNPLPRAPLLPSREHCGDRMSPVRCGASLRERLPSEACSATTGSPRLNATAAGMEATVVDCRPLRARSPELHEALEAFRGSEAVVAAIDLFAVHSTAQLDDLMQEATGYLSRFFDSHMIADSHGRILFEAEVSTTSETETDERRVATPAFSSHVDISELLQIESASSGPARSIPGDAGDTRATTVTAPSFRGHSFVETVPVENVALRVFVHPFVMDGIDFSDDSRQDSRESGASRNGTARPTFYMIGIVDDSEFQSAAIRLRLSLVINATLFLLVLLTLCPLLWFWTAGDRLVIRGLGLAGLCATPVVGVVLFVVLACATVTNRTDEHVLDSTMELVSDRIVESFDQELQEEILKLQHAIPKLLNKAESEEQARQTEPRVQTPQPTNTDENKLSHLEKAFYCDDSDRALRYASHRIASIESPFLLDRAGRQLVCLSDGPDGPLTRTPRLSLEFREYFLRPKEGALWAPKSLDPPQTSAYGVLRSQDKRSRIRNIIDGSFEPGPDDQEDSDSQDPEACTGGTGVPDDPEGAYYLERIDSIVRGDVQTVLSINSHCTLRPAAVSGVRLNSLDRAVPPQHIDFAVIDRETGDTLFHSDDDLAMATNFADDVGGEPALWSLLHSGTSDSISLVYAGIPIRAHVKSLRDGMPWALIVYRGHELEDRFTAVTTALSIFFALFSLLIVLVAGALITLAARWRKPELLESFPVSMGRVMTIGSRFPRTAGAFMGLPLVLLLYSPWLAWNPWPVSNASLLWSAWDPDGMWNGWRGFPFLAFYSIIAAVSFALQCALKVSRSANAERHRSPKIHPVPVLVAIIVCLAVVPTSLWFGHHRARLGVGVNRYLLDRTLESTERAREDYRLDMLREFGRGTAPASDRMARLRHEEPNPNQGWIYDALHPLVGFSKLSNELMVYSALPAPAKDVASLYDGLSSTFGHKIRRPLPEILVPLSIFSFLWVFMIGALVGFVAYSICAICMIVRRRRCWVVELPKANSDLLGLTNREHSSDRPLRAMLLYRNEEDRKTLLEEWDNTKDGNKPTSYNLADVLKPDAIGRTLFEELERKLKEDSPIVVWTRIVPDYRYLDRFGSADRWLAIRRSDDAVQMGRWSSLVREFRSYVLPGTIPDERPYFEDAWAHSTMDERLQLYALARGGVVDTRRTAALSSLVNRGVVGIDNETGVVRLLSEVFGEFIQHDIDHSELDAWRKAGGGGAWRLLWPPLAIGAVLGLAFLAMANPEMRTTLLTALLGLLPTVLPFLRGGQSSSTIGTPSTG